MLFDSTSFHDSAILEVKEITSDQAVDFVLDFPVDWENNIFEKRILRFSNVLVYIKKEIAFQGHPSILDIKILQANKLSLKDANGFIESSKYKIEMITNAGNRFIEFEDAELLSL